eukprot:GEMP01032189.1.p1 GENE.GEMP01032189.1~~GEMP01032189.1.p1  ORF type:complete len:154 (+),score=31.28 GEMP01032189.1:988-1449(+)
MYNAAGDPCIRITYIQPQGIMFSENTRRPVEKRVCVGALIRSVNGCLGVADMRRELEKDTVSLVGLLPPMECVTLRKMQGRTTLGLRISNIKEDASIVRIVGVMEDRHQALLNCSVLCVNGKKGTAELLEEELRSTNKDLFVMDIRYDHVPQS